MGSSISRILESTLILLIYLTTNNPLAFHRIYENTPYVAMRLLPAILGVGLVPITYLTLRALSCRSSTALLGSLFITFENGLITQSRHILLDSPLVFFTGLATFCWVAFTNENRRKAFTEEWWLSLILSGLALGAVVSCKWVGLFTIATVGLSTIRQLWILLGDLRVTPRMWIKHFLARAVCLILIPMIFYMAMFEVHFLILENSGEGDGFMSSEFQHTLGGRGMSDTYAGESLYAHICVNIWLNDMCRCRTGLDGGDQALEHPRRVSSLASA
jgi:dolichyl-phosphate-mannose-protein mannosyltransferase